MQLIFNVLFFLGMIAMTIFDWQHQNVPAWLCDSWVATIGIWTLFAHPKRFVWAAVLVIALTLFALITKGLGSADIIIMFSTSALFGIITALICLFLACISGYLFGTVRKQTAIAFIPHLLLGICLAIPIAGLI